MAIDRKIVIETLEKWGKSIENIIKYLNSTKEMEKFLSDKITNYYDEEIQILEDFRDSYILDDEKATKISVAIDRLKQALNKYCEEMEIIVDKDYTNWQVFIDNHIKVLKYVSKIHDSKLKTNINNLEVVLDKYKNAIENSLTHRDSSNILDNLKSKDAELDNLIARYEKIYNNITEAYEVKLTQLKTI